LGGTERPPYRLAAAQAEAIFDSSTARRVESSGQVDPDGFIKDNLDKGVAEID
jgi:hypothetical protein